MKIKRMSHTLNEEKKGTKIGVMMRRLVLLSALFFMLAVVLPVSASAEAATGREDWQFGADLGLWALNLGGETAGGNTIDVPVDDIIDSLEFAFSGAFHARKDKLHFSTDLLYLNLKDKNSVHDGRLGIKVDAELEMESWVVTPAVGYSVVDNERINMEVLIGARYLYLKSELDLDVTGPLNSRDNHVSDSGDVWDGIIGVRGEVNLAGDWYVPYYLDLGAGDSDYTWQAIAGVGYRINNAIDVGAAYRYLEWKFDDNKVLDSLDVSGPLLGVKFRF